MSDSVDNEVLDILARHAQLERDKVTLSTEMDSIGVDSLTMVEIIYDLEERYDIDIPDPDFVGDQSKQFKTPADVVRVVKEMIQQQMNTE
jgi:acyl carrier protein